jgi:hypothetical protein
MISGKKKIRFHMVLLSTKSSDFAHCDPLNLDSRHMF